MRDEKVVQPAGSGQAHFVGRVENTGGLAQQRLGVIQRDCLQELLRRQSGPARKHTLQLDGLKTGFPGQLVQRGLLAPVFGDPLQGAANDVVVLRSLLADGDRGRFGRQAGKVERFGHGGFFMLNLKSAPILVGEQQGIDPICDSSHDPWRFGTSFHFTRPE